jgi:hypothetical protein
LIANAHLRLQLAVGPCSPAPFSSHSLRIILLAQQ